MKVVPQDPRLDRVLLHVGRAGEYPGGMAQVINALMTAGSDNFEVDVLQTMSRSKASTLAAWTRGFLKICTVRRKPAAVVAHLSQGGSFVREGSILLAARLRGIPTAAFIHGSRYVDFAKARPGLVGAVLRRCDAIFVLSEETRDATAELGVKREIVLVSNGVVDADVDFDAKQAVVMFGGEVSSRKGVDILLKAWSMIAREGWRLRIAGPVVGMEVETREGLGVEVLGPIAHEELMEFLQQSTIAVLPSRHEAMPMFILEAMARGNAIVSTKVGGIPRVVTEDIGVLVEPGNAIELAQALSKVMGDVELRRVMAHRALVRQRSDYSAKSIATRLDEVMLKHVIHRNSDAHE